ncbi:MAG: type II 3-dehydroquinate dehydratase [Anaerolineales bacterium]|nr:type II 3-dehydroquinate dehydratase [Anaerolineales bacterium]
MKEILVLHGPNLNLLGKREPEIYGHLTLHEIDRRLASVAQDLGLQVRSMQFNSEGDLVDALQSARDWACGVVFNPAGYSHTSVALRDTVSAIQLPVIEVHLSNVQAREEFRRHSLIAPVCIGVIAGFGWRSYLLALHAFKGVLEERG